MVPLTVYDGMVVTTSLEWSKVYNLMCSYLSESVVAHGDTSSRRLFTTGVPLGGIWSPLLFNLYTHHLSAQILHCDLFAYADDTTLIKVIPTKDDGAAAAIEINVDLTRACLWGRRWNIIFEPDKCHSFSVSLKMDVDLHPPLYMYALPIAEVDVLRILGIHFGRTLTWNHMIDQLTTRSRQQLIKLRLPRSMWSYYCFYILCEASL